MNQTIKVGIELMLVELVLKFLVVANVHNFIEGLLFRPISVDSSPILH